MAKQSTYQEATSFSASSLIDLFSVNGAPIGLNTIYYFCNGTNTNFQPVVYGGISYSPFPLVIEEVGIDGKNTLPRPKLTLSNINGFVSALLLENSQLVGAIVTRTRVFARFLDAANFGESPAPFWSTPDPQAHYEPEIFYVNRKLAENNQIVSFELASVLDVQNVKLPRRQILANTCQWKYRHVLSCGYAGAPMADSANKLFYDASGYNYSATDRGLFDISETYDQGDYVYIYSNIPQFSGLPIYYVCTTDSTVGINPQGNPSIWIPDSCAKTCAACKLRFATTPLHTSAFPGVARAPFVSRA